MYNVNERNRRQADKRRANIGGLRIKRKVIAILVIITAVLTAFTIYAYAAAPGSIADPIALKSYVDSKLAALETKLTAMIQGDTQAPPETGAGAAPSAGAGAASGASAGAGAGTGAGNSQDYTALTSRINALVTEIDKLKAENNSLRKNVRQLADTAGIELDEAGAGGVAGAGGDFYSYDNFNVIEVFTNQRIILGAGAELVLRTGRAHAIHGELGALVDLISGRDLEAGENVPTNHLILCPRDDNRGVRISEDAWVLIKGAYAFR
jgi:hypothetical protein